MTENDKESGLHPDFWEFCLVKGLFFFLKYEIESIIDNLFPLKNKENGIERNTCQKKLLEK